MIYINKIENRITFKIKTGYYFELLMPQKMKLHESTKSKNGENVSHLEITKVVLILCNIANNDYKQNIQESCIHLFLINHLVNYWIFHQKFYIFKNF